MHMDKSEGAAFGVARQREISACNLVKSIWRRFDSSGNSSARNQFARVTPSQSEE